MLGKFFSLLEAPVEPTLQRSEYFVVGLSTTMLGVDTESFAENDTPRNEFIFFPIFLCTNRESFSPSTHLCVVFKIMIYEMTRSIVDIMISFQYLAHLFLLMCNLPTTGIWLDGL